MIIRNCRKNVRRTRAKREGGGRIIMNYEMMFSKTIFHKNNIDLKSEIIERNAVRAVILKNKEILLVYSDVNDEYKFPGGGIKRGENDYLALEREIKEEIGAILVKLNSKIGEIIEYNKNEKDEPKIFKMTSTYYVVEVSNKMVDQNLDEYEKKLNYFPQWISIEKAIIKNKNTIKERKQEKSNWIERETLALIEINKALNISNYDFV